MVRKIAIVLPLLVSACAAPTLPGGPADDPRWFDSRVAAEAQATTAPESIPSLTITAAEEAERAAAEAATLAAGDAVRNDERASLDTDYDTDAYAQSARERAQPPARVE